MYDANTERNKQQSNTELDRALSLSTCFNIWILLMRKRDREREKERERERDKVKERERESEREREKVKERERERERLGSTPSDIVIEFRKSEINFTALRENDENMATIFFSLSLSLSFFLSISLQNK